MTSSTPPFVLIHGLGAGRWCWEPVIPALEAAGHRVIAPSLGGQDDGATTLSDHLDEVVALFEEHDVRDAVLVGHSYGGMVVTGVADRVPERIARLVFLDAVYPRDGEASFDCLPALAEALLPLAQDGLMPIPPPELLGIETDEQAEIVRRHQLPLPLGCVQEKVRRTEAQAAIPRSYVFATGSAMGEMAERARAEGVDYAELDTVHMLMMTRPTEVTGILLDVAAGTRAATPASGG